MIDIFADVIIERGIPQHICSDNGPEMVARKLRNELLNGEIFYTLREAQVLIEQWRNHYNRVRPHSALGYRPPAPEARGLALVPRNTVQTQRAA